MNDNRPTEGSAAGAEYVRLLGSEQETADFAARLAERAGPGAVVALDGELGAGKTRFAQAFARGLGVTDTVGSPTFTIIKEYDSGRLPFYHMDVYRLSPEEAEELGLEEYFEGNGVSLVEWASRIEPLLPPERLHIVLEWAGPTSRTMRCVPVGERYREWCRQLGLAEAEKGDAP
jgi:tRNA threonylcarbamoyladenosine biosynthesis protein TsaE